MVRKNRAKKIGKDLSRQKGRRSTSSLRKDVKKARHQVRNLDKEGIQVEEILRLSSTGAVRHGHQNLNTLDAQSLQKDWKKDKKIQAKTKAEKQEMAEKLKKQIDSISGFSL